MNANDADHPVPLNAPADAPADAALEAPERPRRRRAPRKKVDVAAALGDAALTDPTGPAEMPAIEAAPVAESGELAPAVGVDGDGAEPAAPGQSPARPEGGRRGRNRRRGRRGAERGADRVDSAAPRAEGAGDEAPAAEVLDAAVPAPLAVEVFAEVLSGVFDAEPSPEEVTPSAPPRRVLAAEPDAPKLHKVLAQAGVGSRRDLEQMIVDGLITVNGEPAHIGQRISFGDRISVGGKPVRYRIAPPPPRVLAYHKPAGEVVTHDDPQQRPTVFRKLPRLQQGKWQSVGRLDINTEGLLLFTNSGELANQLMHPRFGVEREYAVRSLGLLAQEAQARLLEGVEIEGQRAAFKSIEDGGGEGANHWYRVVITEGRNREVRKLFEAVGHAVSRLIRIRYGSVVLPRGLKRGVWTDLDDNDVRTLRRMTGLDRPPARAHDQPGQAGQPGEGPRRKRRGGRGGRDGRDGGVDRPMPVERGPRTESFERQPRGEPAEHEHDHDHEHVDHGPIPNPLQQTFDKRAIQQARATRREPSEDGPIPNPLQQTYDKRALQSDRAPRHDPGEDGPIPNPLQQTYDKRFAPQGQRRGAGGQGGRKGDGERQPDPMQTSVGYIGGDAFLRKGGGGRGGRSRPGAGGGGGGGNTGNGGGRGRGGPRR